MSITTGECRTGWRRMVALGGAWVCGLVVLTAGARGVEVSEAEILNRRCLNCHGQSQIADRNPEERRSMVLATTRSSKQEPEKRPGLYVAPSFAQSRHGRQACVSCHADAKDLPHKAQLGKVTCATGTCHVTEGEAYRGGAHAAAVAAGNPDAPRCATCHGGHNILSKRERESKTYPLNVIKVCGDCHERHVTKTPNGFKSPEQVQNYLESVHGKGVLQAGLTVAATCADCHGPHRVLPSKDPQSSVSRQHVPQTCGKCHVGVSEMYVKSIHGERLAKNDPKAPVCSDCHTAHAITRTDTPEFMRDIVNECGQCHDQPKRGSREKASLYETYRWSYHGQVTQLGSTRAARCSDCHGAHDIKRIDDPASRLNATNKIETCRKCHKGADPKFAEFAPHADFRNGDRYPILHYVYLYFVIMMSASFGFFGLHCLLWLIRSVIERIKHGPRPKHDYSKGYAIQRFNKVDRVNHAFVILTFFGLALTGMPLLYSEKGWAQWLASVLGGVKTCGVLHRVFAVMLICNFVVHGVGVVRRFKRLGIKQMLLGPTTMLPRPKDLLDLLGMYRWFFFGGKKPKFDRWTYWEKFDYMAEVGGSGIIGLSGLLLWFPVFFSAFVPGWAFNVATIVHGFEALLAVGFIFTIHFFNAHLRLEKFPVDDVMFTGRMPEEEFKHERGAEYERLVASGEYEKVKAKVPPPWYRHFAVTMGILAQLIGTALIVGIVLAALKVI